jgi:SAM-dependent methyltransferase
MAKKRHSEEYLTDQRLTWWNPDFLDLMVRRWDITGAERILEVGCGHGHWIETLLAHLPNARYILGVDKEAQWVDIARDRFSYVSAVLHLDIEADFMVGWAESLDIESEKFDVVTCQTLLMHVPNPEQVVHEMTRVLKPGGCLICVEPNNLQNYINTDSVTLDEDIDFRVSQFELWLRYQRGKQLLGEGFNGIGELLVDLFRTAGLAKIETFLSDKVAVFAPPYDTAARASFADLENWLNSDTGPFDESELRRCVRAGGGSEELIVKGLQDFKDRYRRALAQFKRNEYVCGAGSLNYLCSGVKTV